MSLARMVRQGTGKGLLVLLHGLGSNEADLFGLTDQIPESYTVVSLRGPIEYGFGGFAWFNISFNDQGFLIDSEQALLSLAMLREEINSLKSATNFEHVCVGGFSQGAMMAAGLLSSVDSGWLMSGAWLPCFELSDLQEKSVLIQHGTNDQVVVYSRGEGLARILQEQLAEVTFMAYDIGHEVTWDSLQDARRFLAKHL